MLPKPDLVESEIPRQIVRRDGQLRLNPSFPHDGECKSGHFPAPPVETRFFQVVARAGTESAAILDPGVYCEWCLAVANRLKRYTRAGREVDFVVEEEVGLLLEAAWEREGEHYG